MRSAWRWSTRPEQREDHHERKHDEADNDVRSVQADERVEGCAKEICPDGEAFVDDEPVPLLRCAGEKDDAQVAL